MWVRLGRTFNGKRINLKTGEHCISVQQWIGMDLPVSNTHWVCHYMQGNLVGNVKCGNIIFLDFERDVVGPCFSWFPCLLWHSHMFELLSWFRSAQLEGSLRIDLPPPRLPLLVKPHLHLLQYLHARDSVLFIFRYIFVAILTNYFWSSILSC